MAGKGFYHPGRGYWQTITDPSAEIMAAYPAGTVEVPIIPGENYSWDGSAWSATTGAEATTAGDVQGE